jgi:hypothetical protein
LSAVSAVLSSLIMSVMALAMAAISAGQACRPGADESFQACPSSELPVWVSVIQTLTTAGSPPASKVALQATS